MGTLQMRIPNMLTLARFPLGAAFAYCYFATLPVAGFLFVVVGCFTDWLDGYLARKWNVTSEFGKVADAYADKWICWIMTVVAFSILGPNPVLIVLSIIIFGYDVGLSYLRYTLGHREIPVSWYAKAKTTALMLGLLLIYLDWTLGNPLGEMLILLAYAVLVVTGILALLSIGNYLRGYKLEKLIPFPLSLIM